jgi:hypothetical protein
MHILERLKSIGCFVSINVFDVMAMNCITFTLVIYSPIDIAYGQQQFSSSRE